MRIFNLLVLGEGEEYVLDAAAVLNTEETKLRGRVRVCSKSLIFDSEDYREPITKFLYKHISSINRTSQGFQICCGDIVYVDTAQLGTETRVLTPYRVLPTPKPKTYSFHLLFYGGDIFGHVYKLWKNLSSYEEVIVSIDIKFDLTRIGKQENLLTQGKLSANRIKPMLKHRGLIQITDEALYFQPYPNFSSVPMKRYPLQDVVLIFNRTYELRQTSLEILFRSSNKETKERNLFLTFQNDSKKELVLSFLQPNLRKSRVNPKVLLENVHEMTSLWQAGKVTNFHYLEFLNCAAGRSMNDFSQYPIFPWVLDFSIKKTSAEIIEHIQQGNKSVCRDLSKAVGALNPIRLNYLHERMKDLPENEKFLYGSHYSTPAYVVYWLIRKLPECVLRLHGGKFDSFARVFHSVESSWQQVTRDGASQCVMELIPEFFSHPAQANTWLANPLGVCVGKEGLLEDVQLPYDLKTPAEFVNLMRFALESPFISEMLPKWIDLIFGHLQRGDKALEANNIFHPICYMQHSEKPVTTRDAALLTQVAEFGQCPKQLFKDSPHPPKLIHPPWEITTLSENPKLELPWYLYLEVEAPPQVDDKVGPLKETPIFEHRCREAPKRTIQVVHTQEDMLLLGSAEGILEVVSPTFSFFHAFEPDLLAITDITSYDRITAIASENTSVSIFSIPKRAVVCQCFHLDTVNKVHLGPTQLTSASQDETVRLWDINQHLSEISVFDAFESSVTAIDVNNNLILAGDGQGNLQVIDPRMSLFASKVLSQVNHPIQGCQFVDDCLVASMDSFGNLRVFDLRRNSLYLRYSVGSVETCRDFLMLGTHHLMVTQHGILQRHDIRSQTVLQEWTVTGDRALFCPAKQSYYLTSDSGDTVFLLT